jgi:glyoxylase-like metal-dependent hydrolase (beta-lactamase superfamily II)
MRVFGEALVESGQGVGFVVRLLGPVAERDRVAAAAAKDRGMGVTMRLYLLRLATIGADVPVPSYLIRTDDGRNIVVDTGFPDEMVVAAQQPGYQGMPIRDGVAVVARLAAVCVAPQDVHLLVATHLDADHAGAHDARQWQGL